MSSLNKPHTNNNDPRPQILCHRDGRIASAHKKRAAGLPRRLSVVFTEQEDSDEHSKAPALPVHP
jgi:hypothetical protein